MPRLAEIKQTVQETQAYILENSGQLPGSCESAKEIAHRLRGWVYLTETPSAFGIDHKIAIVKQKGTNVGLVIDVTQENAFMGTISDVRNSKLITEELSNLYHVPNWNLMLNYAEDHE
jgi:hypothetical protein